MKAQFCLQIFDHSHSRCRIIFSAIWSKAQYFLSVHIQMNMVNNFTRLNIKCRMIIICLLGINRLYFSENTISNHPVICPIFWVSVEINALLGYIDVKIQTVKCTWYSFLKVYNYFDIIHICSVPTTICVPVRKLLYCKTSNWYPLWCGFINCSNWVMP